MNLTELKSSVRALLLLIAVVTVLVAWIIPAGLHVVTAWNGQQSPMVNPLSIESSADFHQEPDPFSDDPNVVRLINPQNPVQIRTKFVQVGSGTEELNFEELIQAFQPATDASFPHSQNAHDE